MPKIVGFLALLATALLYAPPTVAQIDGNAIRGADLYELRGCLACHGPAGLSAKPEIPHLAGQQRTYLYNQLDKFRTQRPRGRLGYKISERYHGTMEPMASRLTDQDISDIAAFLNKLPCSPGQGRVEATRPTIATKCEFCHGTNGNSPFVAIPKITGQHERYIVQQLEAFRDAAQNSDEENVRAHRLMLAATIDIADAQIEAAAKYYSRLSCR